MTVLLDTLFLYPIYSLKTILSHNGVITWTQDCMVRICIFTLCQAVGLHGGKVAEAVLVAFPAQLMAVTEAMGVPEPVYAKLGKRNALSKTPIKNTSPVFKRKLPHQIECGL